MLRLRGTLALLDLSQQLASSCRSPASAAAGGGLQLASSFAAAASAGVLVPPDELRNVSAGKAASRSHAAAAYASWRGFRHSAAASAGSKAAAAAAAAGLPEKQVLYRGKGMRLFRLLVRVKVFQLTGIAALAVPINTFLATGSLATTQAVMAAALVVGAGVASTALWYYSRRYVGELALLPGPPGGTPPRLQFSVLDFWGKREENVVALQRLVPPLAHLPAPAARAALAEPLLPVDVEGDRQYFLSLRYGSVVDGPTLRALLLGQLDGQRLRADGDA